MKMACQNLTTSRETIKDMGTRFVNIKIHVQSIKKTFTTDGLLEMSSHDLWLGSFLSPSLSHGVSNIYQALPHPLSFQQFGL